MGDSSSSDDFITHLSLRGKKYLQKLQKLTSHLRPLEAVMTFEKLFTEKRPDNSGDH